MWIATWALSDTRKLDRSNLTGRLISFILDHDKGISAISQLQFHETRLNMFFVDVCLSFFRDKTLQYRVTCCEELRKKLIRLPFVHVATVRFCE